MAMSSSRRAPKVEIRLEESSRHGLLKVSSMTEKDQETISWFVMRDQGDRRAFTIVERYEGEIVCGPLFLSCLLFTLHKYLHLAIYTKVTLLYTHTDALTILAIYIQSQKYHLEVCLTFTVAVSDWSFRGPA